MARRLSNKRSKRSSKLNFKYVFIGVVIIGVILFLRYGLTGLNKPHVLGTSTSILLADKGSGGGGDDNRGSGDSSPSVSNTGSSAGSSGKGNSDSSNNSISGSVPTSLNSSSGNVSSNTKVDCVGPDGKHFTTDFHNCQELNQKWGRTNFGFTPLANPKPEVKNEAEQETVNPETEATKVKVQSPQGKLELETEGTKTRLNVQTEGTQVEMRREDNGHLTIHAKKSDGTEVELDNKSMQELNDSLMEKDIEVSTDSANGFIIRSKDTEARTNLPVSIDPNTKTLSVVTADGTKDLNVLPNQAVESVLGQKLLTSTLSKASTSNQNSNQVVGLTEINNEPSFEVQGVTDKKLFGLFPVGFQKSVFVSAVDGRIVKTDESIINKVLQIFSI